MNKMAIAWIVGCALGGTSVVRGEEPRVVKLQLAPAARPVPPLRYRLYPAARELRDGNAAPLYYRALLLMTSHGQGEKYSKSQNRVSELLGLPVDQFPREEARELLRRYQSALHEVDHAVSRRKAEWDIPLHEDGVNTLLMEMQDTRGIARLLALQAHLGAVEGDYAAAIRAIRTMLVMARHVSESGTLISSLVGAAIVGVASEQIEFLATRPGSPNLYWALTALPDPLIDARSGLESEQAWLEGSLPYLDLLERSTLSSEQTAELAAALGELVSQAAEGPPPPAPALTLDQSAHLLLPALSSYTACKQQLLERGLTPERIEAMPVVQVVALRWVQEYRDLLDEEIAFTGRPYAEVEGVLKRLDERQSETVNSPEHFLTGLLLPAVNAANVAFTRLGQRIALLRVIEALRLYAADHEGKLPEKLASIDTVPIPNDPGTGAPFIYELRSGVGVLRPKSFVEEVRYELTVSP